MGDKSAKPSKEYSQSNQEVWAPQADALKDLYGQSSSWLNENQGTLSNLAGQQQQGAQMALQAAEPVWLQNLKGGNLAGYDIAGYQAQQMMQDRDINAGNVNAQTIGQNNIAGKDYNANTVGQVTQSHAYDQYNQRVGPDGSAAQMNDKYRRQANTAAMDMLGATDARAAAAGVGGGSAHGNAMGRGFSDINSNLQDQMADTAYDAYNKDLDRLLGIGRDVDINNQARALQDSNSINQASQYNQANQYKYDQSNQANALNTGMANQTTALNAAQGNQQANIDAGIANQNYAAGQQENLSGLLGDQQQSSFNALGQQEQVQGFLNGPMSGFLNSTAGMQFMKDMLGNPNNQTQQYSTSNGAFGGGVGGSFGTGGANLSF